MLYLLSSCNACFVQVDTDVGSAFIDYISSSKPYLLPSSSPSPAKFTRVKVTSFESRALTHHPPRLKTRQDKADLRSRFSLLCSIYTHTNTSNTPIFPNLHLPPQSDKYKSPPVINRLTTTIHIYLNQTLPSYTPTSYTIPAISHGYAPTGPRCPAARSQSHRE